jgi:replicative DNA helicase
MSGKTFLALHSALCAWNVGRVPLLVSMEMMRTIIIQRLAALKTKKKLTHILKAEMSTNAYNDMLLQLHNLKQTEQPLWIADGSMTSTVSDVLMLCRQFKPSCVYVDGAYLLGHEDKRMGKWDKQAENARALKQRIATDLEIPVVASYQLSKESAKAKAKAKTKGGKVEHKDDMADVYGSDEMAQLSTVMLGLFDDEDAVESKIRRKVKILKGRNGESGEFTINWDMSSKMDLTEVPAENIEDIQFEYMG